MRQRKEKIIKIETGPQGEIVLLEVFSGLIFKTSEGNRLGVCMRDDTFEINVIPKSGPSQWHRVNMNDATVTSQVSQHKYHEVDEEG